MRFALICCAALLVGCGGNGGGGNEPPPSSLAGNWSGIWGPVQGQIEPPGETGSFSITISESGQVTGTCVNTGYGETGTVTGSVTPDGKLDCVVDYPTKTDAIFYGSPGVDLSGRCFFGSEDFVRTMHLYLTEVQLDRE